jgi:Secretion system C-terminal sorting domain
MKKILVLFVILFFGSLLQAQVTNKFVLNADMTSLIGTGAGHFDPATDTLLIQGLNWDDAGVVVVGNRTMVRVGTTNNYVDTLTVTKNTADSARWKWQAIPASKFNNSGYETVDRYFKFGVNNAVVVMPASQPTITAVPPVTKITKNIIKFTADLSGIIGIGTNGHFNPATDSIQVMGMNWTANDSINGNRTMSPDPFTPGIYTTTLTAYLTKDSTEYKFRAFPTAAFSNDGWETSANYWYKTVSDSVNVQVLPAQVPNIFPLFPPLTGPVEVDIHVDMHNAVNFYNKLPIPLSDIIFVGMRGDDSLLGAWSAGNWNITDTSNNQRYMKILNDSGINGDLTAGDGIWSYRVIFPTGYLSGLHQYKFAIYYPGADTVHGGTSPLDNENAMNANHTFILQNSSTPIVLNTTFGSLTGIKKSDNLTPNKYSLDQNYPNPFNPSTIIRYSVPQRSMVSLKIYDITGREVQTLLNQEMNSGNYEVTFNASKLASGVYFYTLRSNNFVSTKKMMLIK